MTTTETFNVWVSTFGLYNAGYLTGYWVEASDAPATIEEFVQGIREHGHIAANGNALTRDEWLNLGEELHCFDTENAPVDGEMSPHTAREYAAAEAAFYEATYLTDDDDRHDLLRAWLDDDSTRRDSSDFDAEAFADNFRGIYNDERDFAQQYADDIGATDNPSADRWPYTHIDWDAATRDLMMDFWSADISGGRVAIFYYA